MYPTTLENISLCSETDGWDKKQLMVDEVDLEYKNKYLFVFMENKN